MALLLLSKLNIGKKIYEVEQDFARDILHFFHSYLLRENKHIRDLQRDIGKFFQKLTGLEKIDMETAKKQEIRERINVMSQLWEQRTEKYKKDFLRGFFLSEGLELGQKLSKRFEGFLEELGRVRVIKEAEKQEERIGINLFKVDKDSIEHFLERKWTPDKKTWSDRVEEIKQGAGREFGKIFKYCIDKGLGYPEILRSVKKQIAKDAVRLENIIRTEGQRIQNDIMMINYHKNQAYLSGIQYLATLDMRTCLVCGSYDGQKYFYS